MLRHTQAVPPHFFFVAAEITEEGENKGEERREREMGERQRVGGNKRRGNEMK